MNAQSSNIGGYKLFPEDFDAPDQQQSAAIGVYSAVKSLIQKTEPVLKKYKSQSQLEFEPLKIGK